MVIKDDKYYEDPPEDHRYVNFSVNVAKYKTTLTKKFINRKKWEPKDPKKIVAGIPGVISKINVKKGQSVKAGYKLLILDAMKMNNILLCPMAGKIKEIYVVEGDRVVKDQVIVELE
jgi:biotin carboxyl carrier protein